MNKELTDAQAPAFIARLLDDLNEEQQLKVPHLMAKYEDTSNAKDLEIFTVIRDLKKYLKSANMAMKASDNDGNLGSANNKQTNSTNPKILEHKKNGFLVVCKKHSDGMHSWLTCLDNEDQTITHHTRKPRNTEKMYHKKQESRNKGSSSKDKGEDWRKYVPKGQNAGKFMTGLMSAYASSVKSSGENSSGSGACYLFAN